MVIPSAFSPLVADRTSAPIEAVLTRVSGFQVVVNEASTPNLSVFRGITDQFIESNQPTRLALPPDTFAHTKADATVTVVAKLANGQDLPTWVEFDARSGTFQMSPPPGFNDDIQIKVTASDSEGREATVIFKLTVGTGKSQPLSRQGLSEQIMLAAKRSSPWAEMVSRQDGKAVADRAQVEKVQAGRAPTVSRQTDRV
jgi:hypothetical protein